MNATLSPDIDLRATGSPKKPKGTTPAEDEAVRLAEMFFSINDPKKEKLGTNPFISREYAISCAIKYSEGMIKEYKEQIIKRGVNNPAVTNNLSHHKQVLRILRKKLKSEA